MPPFSLLLIFADDAIRLLSLRRQRHADITPFLSSRRCRRYFRLLCRHLLWGTDADADC